MQTTCDSENYFELSLHCNCFRGAFFFVCRILLVFYGWEKRSYLQKVWGECEEKIFYLKKFENRGSFITLALRNVFLLLNIWTLLDVQMRYITTFGLIFIIQRCSDQLFIFENIFFYRFEIFPRTNLFNFWSGRFSCSKINIGLCGGKLEAFAIS